MLLFSFRVFFWPDCSSIPVNILLKFLVYSKLSAMKRNTNLRLSLKIASNKFYWLVTLTLVFRQFGLTIFSGFSLLCFISEIHRLTILLTIMLFIYVPDLPFAMLSSQSTQVLNLEMQLTNLSSRAILCFNDIQMDTGIWDIFITKHVEVRIHTV